MRKNQSTEKLIERINDDIVSRDKWATSDKTIVEKRYSVRPATKRFPYHGAPNFVEPLIDDNVVEKTDQEISMIFNAPRLCHTLPLTLNIPTEVRAGIELAFDSYIRHIIRVRPVLEEATDTKNCRGYSILKVVREYNPFVKKSIPSIVAPDIRDIVFPITQKSRYLYNSPYICEIHRYSRDEFFKQGKLRKWNRYDKVFAELSSQSRDSDGDDQGDTFNITENIQGVNSSSSNDTIVVYEIYHYATTRDVTEGYVGEGRKMVTWVCPDAPSMPLDKYPWREQDRVEIEEIPIINIMGRQVGVNRVPKLIPGEDRPWPYGQLRFENVNGYVYGSRGAGHKLMDDQIYATSIRNMKATWLDYFGKPLLRSTEMAENSGNVTFEPGSVLPRGVEPAQMPEMPQNLSFEINSTMASASRRVGSAGLYNYSQNVDQSRKLQKTATETKVEQSRASMISSTAVDRVTDPMAWIFQLLWEDMRRSKVEFPIVSPALENTSMMDPSYYSYSVMMVPAASSKNLDPDILMQKMLGMADWIVAKKDVAPVNISKVLKTVLSQYDPYLSIGWVEEGPTAQDINGRISKMEGFILDLSKDAGEKNKRLENIEKSLKMLLGTYN